jgi:hypothetical protein
MTLNPRADICGRLLCLRVTGQLTSDQYQAILSVVDRHIQQHSKISVVFEMRDFSGLKDDATWNDVDIGFQTWLSVERLALVGEPKWAVAMAVLCRPLTIARIRHFHHADVEGAKAWATSTQAN